MIVNCSFCKETHSRVKMYPMAPGIFTYVDDECNRINAPDIVNGLRKMRRSNTDDNLMSCSFCGKTQKEVKKLIIGPRAFICDKCVQDCNQILGEYMTKHFSKDELKCKHCDELPELWAVEELEKLRNVCDFPFPISSAKRCAEHNEAIGGSQTSNHVKGTAFDIAITDPVKRFQLIEYAILSKLNMREFEVCDRHIHIAFSQEPTQAKLIWGKSK